MVEQGEKGRRCRCANDRRTGDGGRASRERDRQTDRQTGARPSVRRTAHRQGRRARERDSAAASTGQPRSSTGSAGGGAGGAARITHFSLLSLSLSLTGDAVGTWRRLLCRTSKRVAPATGAVPCAVLVASFLPAGHIGWLLHACAGVGSCVDASCTAMRCP